MAESRTVTAVLVSYNNAAELQTCIESLRKCGIANFLVHDNASKDNSADVAESVIGAENVRRSSRNLGYGCGINALLPDVTTDFVLVQNPDATPADPESVTQLTSALSELTNAAIAGPTILDSGGKRYATPRRFPDYWAAIGHAVFGWTKLPNPWSKRYHMADAIPTETQKVDWVSGAVFLARTNMMRGVGGFDPGFFMYMEDVDLCQRTHVAGHDVLFVPDAVFVHEGAASTRSRRAGAILDHHRSLWRYVRKYTSGSARLLLPVFLVGIVARAGILSLFAWRERFRKPAATSDH